MIYSQKHLGDHSEFAHFMNEHPDWRADFDVNPGNYLSLSPHVEKATVEKICAYSE